MGLRSVALLAFAAAVGSAIGLSPARAAEEHKIDAFAPWEGRGQFFQIGTEKAMFVGAFMGTVYVDDGESLIAGGNLICPGSIELNLVDGTQQGAGHCVISSGPGERIYAEWTCSGAFGEGCNGMFTLTEGTGQWQGVSGGGPFSARSELRAFVTMPGNVVNQFVKGLMVWRDFRYSLPQ